MKKISVFAVAYLCLLIQSCDKKKNISADPPLATYYSVDEVFESLRLKPKTLTIDASVTTSFFGNSGTRYEIYGNTLVKADGTPVTGPVQVEVTEWLERGDMIFSKMLPVSNGEPLISGGQLDIKITQNGQALRLKGDNQFRAFVPQGGTPEPGMQLFWGAPAVDVTQGKTNWQLAMRDSNNIEKNMVVISGGDTLSFFSDSLTQCNIDRYLGQKPNYQAINMTIAVTGATADANTPVYSYVMYDNYNVVTPLGFGKQTSFACYAADLPVHFAAFTVIGGKFYGGTVGATPAAGKNYTITLAHTDPVAFKQLVNGL